MATPAPGKLVLSWAQTLGKQVRGLNVGSPDSAIMWPGSEASRETQPSVSREMLF